MPTLKNKQLSIKEICLQVCSEGMRKLGSSVLSKLISTFEYLEVCLEIHKGIIKGNYSSL